MLDCIESFVSNLERQSEWTFHRYLVKAEVGVIKSLADHELLRRAIDS